MKSKDLVFLAIMALVLVSVSVWLLLSFGVLGKLLPDLTVYSDRFTDEKWARIRVGMAESELLETLGIPLMITETGGGRIYRLIKPPAAESYPDMPASEYDPKRIEYRWLSFSAPCKWFKNYRVRAVKIDQNGKVSEVESSCHLD